ncbi:ferredoxin [Mycobacterium sp. E1747]|uniref:ferredoxin n=1 Tax=Mycobacterium sp. E1747 TaxID=1834128 RepID=UPI0007FD0EA9|nr:ferredoxin [Mycobacterium sp. E1747]OBH10420.1 hypothetical protein A5695_22140 [Mycobacterium sp. E1747]
MGIDIRIEKTFCSRSGFCEGAAPEIFELRPGENYVHLKADHVDDEDAVQFARDAAEICPTMAILIEER